MHATAILVKLSVAFLGNLTQIRLCLAGTCCQGKCDHCTKLLQHQKIHLHGQSFQLKRHATAILVKLALASLRNVTQIGLFIAGTCCPMKSRQVWPLSKIALTLKDPFTLVKFSTLNACDSDTGQTCYGFLGKYDKKRIVSCRDMSPKEAKAKGKVNTVQNCFNIETSIYMGDIFSSKHMQQRYQSNCLWLPWEIWHK